MDMKTYLKQAPPEEREALAAAVKSSVGYFYLIAGGHRNAGTDLCKALVAKEPKLTLSDLRPDIWGDAPPAPVVDQGPPHRRISDAKATP